MNRIAEFYESNHLMVLIVLLIVFLMYVISTKKNKDYLKIDINEKTQKNKQIKKVEVELDTQKQVMKIQIFEYTSTRLSFRRSIIEPMNDDDILISKPG
jgi:hypothetical protein